MPLQLLLFIDERSSSQEHLQGIQNYLEALKEDYPFELQMVNVAEQPHLAENFRLVATPALVKIAPQPRQTIAGTNLVNQLEQCWSRWVQSAKQESQSDQESSSVSEAVTYSGELTRLSDEIFRLKQENQELNEQIRFKDQVLAMLAHDLRNPLTAASIALETLELTDQNPDQQKVEKIKKQIFRQAQTQFRIMNRMITDILQTAQGKDAELNIQPQKLNLQALSHEILDHFQDTLARKCLNVKKDLPQDVPEAHADPELIRQVIVNLLDNAVKYTSEKGTIKVSLLHRTSQKIQVTICDDGPGIPPEKRESIFEGRVRLKRDEAKEGYGLGLSLCRQVVRAHYGEIWVDSDTNRGSCFHFTLPVY
ncbi:histidine kinase [Euhalothece natronophila Z-M001]|uniref:Adaptive-response sensory-kinase SasA n=1 Tax=Euhalothece natronophila Z-M001 TaxID=522448 RepID=A0A5B8NIC7_9CHRO|nr:histidine kinase [Euhalothece natronophila]QDZ38686.1 histidine kinase [Euhalothece natronophila Z-M001]